MERFLGGGRRRSPTLIVEIASPHTRVNDVVTKFAYYHDLQIPEYVIIDQEKPNGPRKLLHYRYSPKEYVLVPPDEQGLVHLPVVKVRLGLRDNRAICFDEATGEEFKDYADLRGDLKAVEQRLRELEAEVQRLRGQSPP
jgi:hypothetical protein